MLLDTGLSPMTSTVLAMLLHVLGTASLLSPGEAVEAERDFRAWINGLETCSASYHLVMNNLDPGEGVLPFKEESYEYRYDHGDFVLVMPSDDPHTGEHGTLKNVWHNGTYSYRLDTPSEKARGINGVVVFDLGAWQYPPLVYSMPHEWFGFDTEGRNSLLEALDAGNVYAFEQSGLKVLSCWIQHSAQNEAFDAYLDESGTVLQIDMMRRLAVGSLEQLREFWQEDPLAYGLVTHRFEFWGHADTGGLSFPLYVRESIYRQKNDLFRAIMDDYVNGRLSDNEYRFQAARAWPKLDVLMTREVEVDPATLVVNEPLPSDTFTLAYGAGAMVGTGRVKTLWHVPVWYGWIRNPWLWTVLGLGLAALGGALFWGMYSRRKEKTSRRP